MLHQKFKFSPTLSSWNPDKYPYYLASISDVFNGNSVDTYLSEKRGHSDEIIFINKGSATVSHFYVRRGETKTVEVAQNDVIFSPGGTYCEFSNISSDLEFTVIHFSLYTCDAISSTKHSLNLSNILSEDMAHMRVYINIPLHTKLADSKKFRELISGVSEEFNNKAPGYQMQIQISIIQMLLILLRDNSPEFDSALCNVNLVGISSKYGSNTAMPPNCRLTISDVEILPKKPEPSKKRTPLSVYKTSKPSLLPEYHGIIKYEHEKNSNMPDCITISAETESGYHVWLFPDTNRFTPDLRAYKKNAYIRFFVKSTLAMSFCLVIYNHDNHHCINHTFYIEPSEELREFCVPLLQNTEEKKMPTYIYDTLDYIDKNYSSKIKLEEIAKCLHLNPSYLSKLFKEHMGISISEHILSRRLNAAVIMLKKFPDKPIIDIAIETGFYDAAHFSKAFKNAYSTTVLQYKKQLNNITKN